MSAVPGLTGPIRAPFDFWDISQLDKTNQHLQAPGRVAKEGRLWWTRVRQWRVSCCEAMWSRDQSDDPSMVPGLTTPQRYLTA